MRGKVYREIDWDKVHSSAGKRIYKADRFTLCKSEICAVKVSLSLFTASCIYCQTIANVVFICHCKLKKLLLNKIIYEEAIINFSLPTSSVLPALPKPKIDTLMQI